MVGNAANQVFPNQEYLDAVYETKNGYTELFYHHYGTEVGRIILLHYLWCLYLVGDGLQF